MDNQNQNPPSPFSEGTKQINIKIPRWFKITFLIGMFFAFIIVALIIFGILRGIQQTQHLSKVGVKTEAMVTSASVVKDSSSSSNDLNNTVSYQTNVTYKLLGVAGYADKEFNSYLPSNNGTPSVVAGQQIAVVYDPGNPSINEIQSNMKESSLASILFIAVFAFLGFGIYVVIASVKQFNRRRKIINDLKE